MRYYIIRQSTQGEATQTQITEVLRMRYYIILQSTQGEATRCVLTLKSVWVYNLFCCLYKLCDDSPGDGLLRRKRAVVLAARFVVIYGKLKTLVFLGIAGVAAGSCCDLHTRNVAEK